ncbi:MAG TPA: redoxin domain-containing protein [Thermoanaerobaculia bacterium]|nr:redoxin domain-containing protein [Thermoanaerobaculia bacterium]
MPPITVPLHAPELAPGRWVQGPPVSIAFSRGAVVLVDFWESTCVNCLRTLPYLKAWHERYAGRGLVIVGVHTPEFEFTADPELVTAAARAEGIPYPVLLDQDRGTWQRFANHYWPARYLIDARGYLRYEHFGEGAYGQTEEWLQRLLREAGDAAPMPELLAPVRDEDRPGAVCHPATREVHLGFHRGRLLAPEGYRPGEEVRHRDREEGPAPPGMFTARGLWRHEAEFLETREPGAELDLVCEASGVNLVLEPTLEPAGELEIEVDGAPVAAAERGVDVVARAGRTFALWERPRMVRLLDSPVFRRRHLVLRFAQPGVRAYAFSFSTCAIPLEDTPPGTAGVPPAF